MSKVDISDFARKLDAVSKAYAKVPLEVAVLAERFSKERFRSQAWLDKSSEAWKPRAQRRKGGQNKSQTLLVDKGQLKKSVRKISWNSQQVIIGSDVPYAQIHNDGGTISATQTVNSHKRKEFSRKRKGRKETVKEHSVKSFTRKVNIKIPKRQFIGNSETLKNQIIDHITNQFTKALES